MGSRGRPSVQTHAIKKTHEESGAAPPKGSQSYKRGSKAEGLGNPQCS